MNIPEHKQVEFWLYVLKLESGCWEWQKSTQPNGYGQWWIYDKVLYTHRISYEIANGPIPPNKMIRHTCHNRKCVNPDHLRLGTNAENMQDCIDRGDKRVVTQFGEMHFNAKLTDSLVIKLRAWAQEGKNVAEMAKELNLNPGTLGRAITGKTWSHLPGALPPEVLENKGDRSGRAKLTEEKVREIKTRLAAGESGKTLAKEFIVTPSAIDNIKAGRTWKHVN